MTGRELYEQWCGQRSDDYRFLRAEYRERWERLAGDLEREVQADTLLRRVHERLGGLGVDITTFGEADCVEVRWRREYGADGGLSDERFAQADSLEEALTSVLVYEDAADESERVDECAA